MTSDTHLQYVDLLNEMAQAARDSDRLRYEATKDKFRALPGFPYHMNPDTDRAIPRINDLSGRVVTIGSRKAEFIDEWSTDGIGNFSRQPRGKPIGRSNYRSQPHP